MAPDENDPRRNRNPHDEHNPFIAFRRFADSQVASVMNTVFTLPATIANYRNVHIAREQCLFGRADKEKCERLRELEEETTRVIAECRELYHSGNVQQALDKGQAVLLLNHDADMIRRQIVDGSNPTSTDRPSEQAARLDNSNELVEKVANEKGQQFGWSWDWGFPRPFDADEDISSRRDRSREWHRRREESTLTTTRAEEQKHALEDNTHVSDVRSTSTGRVTARMQRDVWIDEQRRYLRELNKEITAMIREQFRHTAIKMDDAYDIAGDAEVAAELARIGVSRDAFEDLVRCQFGYPMIPEQKLGLSNHMSHLGWAGHFFDRDGDCYVGRHPKNERLKLVPWEGEETAEEPNYEYAHDHEDQHDEPPSPKTKQSSWSNGMPETELEAYERLLDPSHKSESSTQTEGRPSILSTLTTTERTVHPDGTVTTKVVLKKRFNDGREESSETVHTERAQESAGEENYNPSNILEAAAQRRLQEQLRPSDSKKSGWFWSS